MRARLLLATVMVVLVNGCAPSVPSLLPDAPPARRPLAAALVDTNEWCKGIVARTLVEKEQRCHAGVRAVYQEYGVRPDTLREAEFAYRVAIAERVDRGTLSILEARALVAEFRRGIERSGRAQALEQQRLELAERQVRAAEDAATAEILAGFNAWYAGWQRIWQPPRQPIHCYRYGNMVSCY